MMRVLALLWVAGLSGAPAREPAGADIPAPALAAYFDARPQTYLIDPQHLLDLQAARDQLDFLTSHAADSGTDLFIYVFGSEQQISAELRHEEAIERLFESGRPALIAHYYLGAPQRADLYLSPALRDSMSPAEQRRALQGAGARAAEKSNPQEQLQEFSFQLAASIYRIEERNETASAAGPTQRKPLANNAKNIKKKPSLAQRWTDVQPIAEELAVPALLLASLLATTACLFIWLRRRATYRFPELEVEPRLGGTRAAGVGAVINFASADLPPASQRNQVADWARRG